MIKSFFFFFFFPFFFFFGWIIMVKSSKLLYLPAFPWCYFLLYISTMYSYLVSPLNLFFCKLYYTMIPIKKQNKTIQWGLSLKSVLYNLESWWANLIVPDVKTVSQVWRWKYCFLMQTSRRKISIFFFTSNTPLPLNTTESYSLKTIAFLRL